MKEAPQQPSSAIADFPFLLLFLIAGLWWTSTAVLYKNQTSRLASPGVDFLGRSCPPERPYIYIPSLPPPLLPLSGERELLASEEEVLEEEEEEKVSIESSTTTIPPEDKLLLDYGFIMCVAKCPISDEPILKQFQNTSFYGTDLLLRDTYNSQLVGHFACLPTNPSDELEAQIVTQLALDRPEVDIWASIQDLLAVKRILFIGPFLALPLSLLFLVCALSFPGPCMTSLVLTAPVVALAIAIAVGFVHGSIVPFGNFQFGILSFDSSDKIVAFIFVLFSATYAACCVSMRRWIRISQTVFDTTASALKSTAPWIYCIPFITLVIEGIIAYITIETAGSLLSCHFHGGLKLQGDEELLPFSNVEVWHPYDALNVKVVPWWCWWNLSLWLLTSVFLLEVVMAAAQYLTSAWICLWYFSLSGVVSGEKEVSWNDVKPATIKVLTQHLGTIALVGFLNIPLRFIRAPFVTLRYFPKIQKVAETHFESWAFLKYLKGAPKYLRMALTSVSGFTIADCLLHGVELRKATQLALNRSKTERATVRLMSVTTSLITQAALWLPMGVAGWFSCKLVNDLRTENGSPQNSNESWVFSEETISLIVMALIYYLSWPMVTTVQQTAETIAACYRLEKEDRASTLVYTPDALAVSASELDAAAQAYCRSDEIETPSTGIIDEGNNNNEVNIELLPSSQFERQTLT